jgi:heme A synthase
MAPPRKPARNNARSDLIRSITTPLGFFVLALLIVEATLGIVLSASKLSEQHVWTGFLWMAGVFIGVVLVVAGLTIFSPKNLLYGKEEYVNPTLEPSALKDQIEDLIAANVRPDCLK